MMTDDSSDTEQSFISHLIELRDRLLRVLIVVILAIVALFPFSNTLYNYLA
ncbi:twin-arginine protein translocation system subunit TatC, partial [Achromatium sp. WMS2]